MRIKSLLQCTILVVLTACTAQSEPLPTASALSTATMLVLSPSPTEFPTATPAPTLTPTSTPLSPPAVEDIQWTTYQFSAGVSFEYPSDWPIASSHENSVEFIFPYFPWNVSVYIYDRPLKDKAIADPHTWSPNEGGYELLWERPISIEDAKGLEFIYGVPTDNRIGGILIANYYSEKHELEVRFQSSADMIPTESAKYDIFEYMIHSVRIAP